MVAIYLVFQNMDLTFRVTQGFLLKFRTLFTDNSFSEVDKLCFQLGCFMQVNLPKIYHKIVATLGIDLQLITFPWFMTLFTCV